ncbi:MAG: general secretion pathway protein GspK [Bdellovibrionales bacterium]|nr:general secretion pathway protein GspK [Bdellovibrionales bacterium]
MFSRKRISSILQRLRAATKDNRGVALFIVLTAMATLAIFVGEITYTAQINQKLAYDRLDQIKAHSLAKSGLRLALLRIRAYSEIKKTISSATKAMGGTAADANAAVPKAILEKIWNEPITIPFSGDVSGLPLGARDAIQKFRKDSSMEGKVYIAIQAQSERFNLNSTISAFAPSPTVSPTVSPTASPTASPTGTPIGTGAANPSATPIEFDQEQARKLLSDQLKDTFAKKFEEDEKFRDRYRNLRPEDLTDEILGWSDLTYQSQAAQRSEHPFKQAPFYDISELHYLPSVDDDLFDLLASQYSTGVASAINVNMIKEPVLAALVPLMTPDERKKFFEYRDNLEPTDDDAKAAAAQGKPVSNDEDHTFKTADDFYKYLKDKVAAFAGSDSKVTDFKTALTQRGISITTEESNFIVRIEATINQTKRTLEAYVSLLPDTGTPTTGGTTTNGSTRPSPTPNLPTNPVNPNDPNAADPTLERSNLKITQLRFL